MTAAAYFAAWSVRNAGGVSSRWSATRISLISKWALPHIGQCGLSDLQPDHLFTILAQPGRLSPSSRNKVVFSALRAMLHDAVYDSAMPTGVFAALYARTRKLPEPAGTEMFRPLTITERDSVLGAFGGLHPAWFPYLLWQFLVGTRPSEAKALRWTELDKAHGRARIIRGWVQGELTTLKTARSRRDVAVPGECFEALRLHTELEVFAHVDLDALRRDGWYPVLHNLGIVRTGLYATRATAISTWVDQGMSIADAAYQAGDKVSTIERHYQRWTGAHRIAIEQFTGR